MSKLIKRQEVIELIKNSHYDLANSEDDMWAMVADVEKLPVIEAVPIRHGKWIIKDNPGTGWYRVTCSECGEDATSTAPCIGFFPNAKVTWDYCPSCGADMRGDNSENE